MKLQAGAVQGDAPTPNKRHLMVTPGIRVTCRHRPSTWEGRAALCRGLRRLRHYSGGKQGVFSGSTYRASPGLWEQWEMSVASLCPPASILYLAPASSVAEGPFPAEQCLSHRHQPPHRQHSRDDSPIPPGIQGRRTFPVPTTFSISIPPPK